ncbi:4-hydroxyphenylpyruvate dioxygenase [Geitlerinema sp. PCC 9228]|uniref:4-hydroxyphenylpyruvate dioxygenase n=1 Tax=Geitlerinema sp. PCC 9228 TaxID=111611 RepID=UPI0008F98D29|nr:4-hydroxyphenylpyruvate dioxygenase [Geitlerinema sp. PCC 9228]
MDIGYVHFYVKDAVFWRQWFQRRMAWRWLDSIANQYTHTELLHSGAVFVVFSMPKTQASSIFRSLQQFPPGVADVAFQVRDLDALLAKAVAAGARLLQPQQSSGGWKWAKLAGWGRLTHTVMERLSRPEKSVQWVEDGDRLQPFVDREAISDRDFQEISIEAIDHAVLNVPVGELQAAVDWYCEIFGFQPRQNFNIRTQKSGLSSQVLTHPLGNVQLPVNEPTSANSQIQEFLNYNRGAGIQHIALKSNNILASVAQMRRNGISFLSVPDSYYEQLKAGCDGLISPQEFARIQEQEILVDWKQDEIAIANQNYREIPLLLQTFTKPIFEEPTFFFEVIERRSQARGFGEGNFKALFEAIEREQQKRGTI